MLGAQAALICEIWRRRTGRRQTAMLDMEGAAFALQSVFYERQWQYPIMLTEPSYPTVAIYPTKDDRWIMINGGYPKLRDGLLELLNSADSVEAVRAAIGKWNAADLEEGLPSGACARSKCARPRNGPTICKAGRSGRSRSRDHKNRRWADRAVSGGQPYLSADRPPSAFRFARAGSHACHRRADLRENPG